jgi:Uncharacterized membrane-anchored protein conserved in bacteria
MPLSVRTLSAGVLLLLMGVALGAQDAGGAGMTAEEFESKLGYQTGTITLPGSIATIQVPDSFRFLGAEGSKRLLTQGWGNPPSAAEGVVGMLVPSKVSPVGPGGWGIVMTFDEDGFVDDNDAAHINYTKLLNEMQEQSRETNAARQKQGFEPVQLVGWAEPPSYDAAAHKLYWAKELAFGHNPTHTLNYNIRILGRRGVLVLNAVADMDQLATIRAQSRTVLTAINFNEGHRYTDYLPGTDKAAAYGVAGLIVGATAAKAGFFKALLVGLLAFKKLIVVAAAGLVAALRRLFGASKEPETTDAPV